MQIRFMNSDNLAKIYYILINFYTTCIIRYKKTYGIYLQNDFFSDV